MSKADYDLHKSQLLERRFEFEKEEKEMNDLLVKLDYLEELIKSNEQTSGDKIVKNPLSEIDKRRLLAGIEYNRTMATYQLSIINTEKQATAELNENAIGQTSKTERRVLKSCGNDVDFLIDSRDKELKQLGQERDGSSLKKVSTFMGKEADLIQKICDNDLSNIHSEEETQTQEEPKTFTSPDGQKMVRISDDIVMTYDAWAEMQKGKNIKADKEEKTQIT